MLAFIHHYCVIIRSWFIEMSNRVYFFLFFCNVLRFICVKIHPGVSKSKLETRIRDTSSCLKGLCQKFRILLKRNLKMHQKQTLSPFFVSSHQF